MMSHIDYSVVEWTPDASIQEFYSNVMFTGHYGLIHRGHEYFITWDYSESNKELYVVYDRNLCDAELSDKSSWDNEPKELFDDLTSLCFGFVLKNDGRSIADYICDCNGTPRLIVPEPICDGHER